MKQLSANKFEVCSMSQPFGGNSNSYYVSHGLKGHTGVDVVCGYGTDIFSDYDGYVYKVLTEEKPALDGSNFTGVFMIVDTGIELFEWTVGHCNPTVTEGQYIKKGDKIGTEANHGIIYSGNTLITPEMQRSGDHRGSHRHVQKRPVSKIYSDTGYLLTLYGSGEPYKDAQGCCYEYAYPDNGYAGCIDPYLPVFTTNLTIGMAGYDVMCLQKLFVKEGIATYEPTGYFGFKTLASTINLQRKNNIRPALGFVGPITISFINKLI